MQVQILSLLNDENIKKRKSSFIFSQWYVNWSSLSGKY